MSTSHGLEAKHEMHRSRMINSLKNNIFNIIFVTMRQIKKHTITILWSFHITPAISTSFDNKPDLSQNNVRS